MQTPLKKENYEPVKSLSTSKVDYNELLGHYLRKMQWQEEQSIQECISQLLNELIPFLGGVKATFYLAYNDTQTLSYLTGYGVDEKSAHNDLKYGEEMVGQVAKTKKSLYQSYQNEVKLFTGTFEISIKGVLILPIMANQELVGMLEIALIKTISDHKYNFLQQLAQHIGSDLKIRRQEQMLRIKNRELEQKNTNITSSIKYACTIQKAILPTTTFLNKVFMEHFVIYLPKDLVSGDFYWVSDVSENIKSKPNIEKRLVVATMDCTGHGVPGSMMSMVGNTLLNQIVKEQRNHDPASILLELHGKIKEALKQEESDNHDGMDGGIAVLNYLKNGGIEITYAGAKRALVIARLKHRHMQLIKGDRTSLGGLFQPETMGIKNQTLTLDQEDILYFTTDGFEDACCPLRKKYRFKKLAQDLKENMRKPLAIQREILLQKLNEHKRGTPQRDDITLFAVKL